MDNLYYLLSGISVACYLMWLVGTALTAHYYEYKWLPYYGWAAAFFGAGVAFLLLPLVFGDNP